MCYIPSNPTSYWTLSSPIKPSDPVMNQVTYLPQFDNFICGPSIAFDLNSQPFGLVVNTGSYWFTFTWLSHRTAPGCTLVGSLSESALEDAGATSFSSGSMCFHADSMSAHFHTNGPSMSSSVGLNAPGFGFDFWPSTAHSTRLILQTTTSIEPYVPLLVNSNEPTMWYLDSSATNHVCQEIFTLNNLTKDSGNNPLLMGDGTCVNIEHLGHSTISTTQKLLHLTNVLHMSKIRKNLLSITQFARENNVFFKFHPFHSLVNDIQTQEI